MLEKEWILGFEANPKTEDFKLTSLNGKTLSTQAEKEFTDLGQGIRFSFEPNTPESTSICTPVAPDFSDAVNNNLTVQFCFQNTGGTLESFSYQEVSSKNIESAQLLGGATPIAVTTTSLKYRAGNIIEVYAVKRQ